MPALSIFSGYYGADQAIILSLAERMSVRHVDTNRILERAAAASGLEPNRLSKALLGKTSAFNVFTHERERALAHLKLAMAEQLTTEDGLLLTGIVVHLIPRTIPHVLRVCLIADARHRATRVSELEGISTEEALRTVHRRDEELAAQVLALTSSPDPWSPSHYDIVIPLEKTSHQEAIALIVQHSQNEVLKVTPASRQAVEDMVLAAKVEVALAREGHCVTVSASSGDVILTINKHVLMLNRLEEELRGITRPVAGVRSVKTVVGSGFHQADIYRRYDFELPSKVLLVDDEREFVQTLSERLQMRDVGSAVAFDGASALEMVSEDEPEVMILDLKMPGIDGIEVLRQVKQTRPEIEVIILSGHGSEQDRETCLKLGAFAYLQKPADIEVLTRTLKAANDKMRQNFAEKEAKKSP